MIKRDAYLDKLVYAMGNSYLRLSENKYNPHPPIRLWLGRWFRSFRIRPEFLSAKAKQSGQEKNASGRPFPGSLYSRHHSAKQNQTCPRSRRHFEHSFLCRKFPVKCRKNRPVAKYIGYLKGAFLVHSAQRFDIKGKRYIGSPLKFGIYIQNSTRFICK